MARSTGQRPSKAISSSNSTSRAPASSTLGKIPEPFKSAPISLRPFLSTLPTTHIYLVHVDKTSPVLKRRVFMVPLFMNLFIVALLCLRIYYAAPVYLEQIITIFGYDTAYKVDTQSTSAGDIMGTLTSRTFLLMVDYAIFVLLGSWPREFMFGNKASRFVGPWEWRRTIGFKDTEIIVRRGRKWDTPLLQTDDEDKTWNQDEELTIKVKVEPAMRKTYLSKTGYLLLDKDFDLDFKGMLDAHDLVDAGTVKRKELEDRVLVYHQKQWLVWNLHEASTYPEGDPEEVTKIEIFREKLIALRREDVFFRWIEIVQYETSQPGGFSEGRQAEAMRELRRLLTDRGVDYAKFWDDIGGQKGLPGFE